MPIMKAGFLTQFDLFVAWNYIMTLSFQSRFAQILPQVLRKIWLTDN